MDRYEERATFEELVPELKSLDCDDDSTRLVWDDDVLTVIIGLSRDPSFRYWSVYRAGATHPVSQSLRNEIHTGRNWRKRMAAQVQHAIKYVRKNPTCGEPA